MPGEVRDWGSMRAMSERLLAQRTGQGVAAWNERIARLGPVDAPALRAWLKAQGVTGYAAGLLVMERFGYPDYMTAAADELIEAQYAAYPQLRGVYECVVDAAAGFGDVVLQARKTYVCLVAPRRTFARLKPAKAHLAVALRLDRKPGGRLHPSRVHESSPVELRLAQPQDLDEEALAWLEEAYVGSR